MASDAEMASYIADMLNPLGEVRIKRMFGEYCFYVNEKPVGFLFLTASSTLSVSLVWAPEASSQQCRSIVRQLLYRPGCQSATSD